LITADNTCREQSGQARVVAPLVSSIIAVNQTDTFRPGPEGRTG